MVNIGILMLGNVIVPLPEGTDPMNPESLAAAMESFTAANYIFPFLAHAGGTLVGAFIVTKIAANHHFKFAMGIAALFFIGGVINVINLPAPVWFEVADLVLAYFPMAWIGWKAGHA